MLEFHSDIETYFKIQYLTSKDHIIPYLKGKMDMTPPLRVLEVGCGEAGVLKAFLELGHHCTGIELEQKRVDTALSFFEKEVEAGQIELIVRNIYDIDPMKDKLKPFDLIILKDVIEHIPDQEKIIPELKKLSKPGGILFFAFPPWYMPFGGHQQIVKSKVLSKLPWIHLLPRFLYKSILKSFGEPESTVKELMELDDTGISIERFDKIASKYFSIEDMTMFFINPIYQYKFKLKVKKVIAGLKDIPFIRNFYTTAVYFTLKNDK